ncbi:MAG: AMP-binding protein [Desulfovibrio sp.]|uniref:AMP-binding protein n=1 Tax=Desulfovibrio sp. TaxID=885 RepID=UPI00135DD81D|nr:AMP-binding protein [Desulfovibrio sp.]MTJ91524.1 AMP-binding protein [Desulfovibrio sp.]
MSVGRDNIFFVDIEFSLSTICILNECFLSVRGLPRFMNAEFDQGVSMRPFALTIGDFLSYAAEIWPETDALIQASTGERLSWRELDALTDAYAKGLWVKGLRAGDTVVGWSCNSVSLIVCGLAAIKIGAVFVPVSIHLTRPEIADIVLRTRCACICYADGYRDVDYATVVNELFVDCADATEPSTLKFSVNLGGSAIASSVRAADLAELGVSLSADFYASIRATVQPHHVASILFTSGSTCRPKGVMLTHDNLVNNAFFSIQRLGLDAARDLCCMAVPLFHCFGLSTCLIGSIACGVPLVILERYRVSDVIKYCEEYKCTVLHGVPTMFGRLLEAVSVGESNNLVLKKGIIAGSQCSEALVAAIVNRLGMDGLSIAYGQTETSPCCTQTFPDADIELKCTTIGVPLPGVEMKVVDPDTGDELLPGEIGELWTRGFHVMRGYLGLHGQVSTVMDDTCWYHTGDAGFVDIHGDWHYSYRIKDIIVRGGENISPIEIECALKKIPYVYQVKVFGVFSKDLGEEVVAVVIPCAGHSITESDLKNELYGKIAHYKIPSKFMIIDEMPLNDNGKINIQYLKDRLSAECA